MHLRKPLRQQFEIALLHFTSGTCVVEKEKMLYFKLLNEQLLINFLEEPRQLLKQLGQFLKNFCSNLWLRVPIVVLYVWV